jgi:hypothetical protein
MADSIDLADVDQDERRFPRVLEPPGPQREVTVRDLDLLRTRLELLHEMADDDRRERERHRSSVQAALTEMAQAVRDVRRDHRGIRQTLGDLANIVNRQIADGSATRVAYDELRSTVAEVREEGRTAAHRIKADTRKAVDQIEAHARMDRDWILATQANVERLAADLARHAREAGTLHDTIERADGALLRQQANELEHVALVREQLAEATALIEELGAAVKRQAGQIAKLRTDVNKATSAPAAKPTAKKSAAKRTSRDKAPTLD